MTYDSERWKVDVGLLGFLVLVLLPLSVWILTGAQDYAEALQILIAFYGILSFYGLLIVAYAILKLGHILAAPGSSTITTELPDEPRPRSRSPGAYPGEIGELLDRGRPPG